MNIINKRLTPMVIKTLKENEVFVFPSNEAGKHIVGASHLALSFGAKFGKSEGLCGNTYALPLKDKTNKRLLSHNRFNYYVDRFIDFVKNNSDKTFIISALNKENVEISNEFILSFKECLYLENVFMPSYFWKILVESVKEDECQIV